MRKHRVKILKTLFLIAFALLVVFGGFRLLMNQLYPLEYQEIILEYSRENDLDPAFVFAVVKCESGFDPNALSIVEAKGLMQLTDETFQWLQTKTEEKENYPPEKLFDPQTNIRYGTLLLRMHLDEFDSPELALAAYHAGRGKVNEWIDNSQPAKDDMEYIQYEDTQKYVKKVLETQKLYQRLYTKQLEDGKQKS